MVRNLTIYLLLVVVSTTAPATLVSGWEYNGMAVAYGYLGDNLPPPNQVLDLLNKCGIQQIRLYDPNPQILDALNTLPPLSRILTSIGVKNSDLAGLAGSLDTARAWLKTNYAPYYKNVPILTIIVGNEVVPGDNAQYLVPAMRNLRTALDETGDDQYSAVLLTTGLSSAALNNSYPPSQATFTPASIDVMKDLVAFQNSLPPGNRGTILVHIYPYFAYAADPANVRLEYALFESKAPVVQDGDLAYYNLFSAMYDGFIWAMEKIGDANAYFDVGETGWPSAGNGDFTTPALAQRYNTNLFNLMTQGQLRTPKKADEPIGRLFVFALFNENQKPAGIEQNWGLLNPNMSPVYPTPLCPQ